MTIHARPFRFVHLAIACATTALLWVGTACNGILGNTELTADAGAGAGADATTDAFVDPSAKCPGAKYCSAIDSCGPTNDPSFGCAAASCAPCNVPNATAKCGGTGCTIDTCNPGFLTCGASCVDASQPANCGKCNTPCLAATPLCAPSAGAFPYVCTAACIPPQQQCAKRCVDVTTTVADCGSCGHDCRGGQPDPPGAKWTCVSSKCVLECTAGFHACPVNGVPTCVRQDATSCGEKCQACPSGPNSTPGCFDNGGVFACGFICNADVSGGGGVLGHKYKQCPPTSGCVDIENDRTNCGNCGESCLTNSGTACQCATGKCNSTVPTCHAVP